MSDRDHEELFLTRLRLVLAAGHTAAYDLRADISALLDERRAILAAPPPVLSRQFLDSLIMKLEQTVGDGNNFTPDYYAGADEAFELLRDAILESLSPKESE